MFVLILLFSPVAIFTTLAVLGHLAGFRADEGEEVRLHVVGLLRASGHRIIRIRGCHDWEWSPNAAWPRVELAWRCDVISPEGERASWIAVFGSARPRRDHHGVMPYRGRFLTFYRHR